MLDTEAACEGGLFSWDVDFAARGGAVLDCAHGYQKEKQEKGGEEEFCPQEARTGETV